MANNWILFRLLIDEFLLFYCTEHVKSYRLDVPEVHNYFQGDRDLPAWRTEITSLPSSKIVCIVLFEREYTEPWDLQEAPSFCESERNIFDLITPNCYPEMMCLLMIYGCGSILGPRLTTFK